MRGVAGSTPLIGEQASRVLIGGDAISSVTLARIYTLHVVILPALLVVLLTLLAGAWRRIHPARTDPLRLLGGAVAVLALVGCLAWFFPPALGAPADPTGAGAPDARPEWFFLWINQLLRWFPEATFEVGALIPGLLTLLVLGLPWIARGTPLPPSRRKPELVIAACLLAGVVALGGMAAASAREVEPETSAGAKSQPQAQPETKSLEQRAQAVLTRFQCGSCHSIDGDLESDATGPPLNRKGFAKLYTRTYFRLRVGDPLAFWHDTQMNYTPRRRKPTKEQLDLLEAWFFGDR